MINQLDPHEERIGKGEKAALRRMDVTGAAFPAAFWQMLFGCVPERCTQARNKSAPGR
ncbi:hypothetical protein CCP2SC5_1130003 [Azospirillaceae bacterium]